MPRVLSIRRSQLAEFIKDHKTIKEFENLFTSDNDLTELINNILDSLGIGIGGIYTQRSDSNYLNSSTNMFDDSTFLDVAIFDYTREYIRSVTTNTALDAMAQTVLCDASTGGINITLPLPSDCFSDSRSFRIAIHKTDASVNSVSILPNGSELIVGEESQTLGFSGEILNLITDGTNWYLGA